MVLLMMLVMVLVMMWWVVDVDVNLGVGVAKLVKWTADCKLNEPERWRLSQSLNINKQTMKHKQELNFAGCKTACKMLRNLIKTLISITWLWPQGQQAHKEVRSLIITFAMQVVGHWTVWVHYSCRGRARNQPIGNLSGHERRNLREKYEDWRGVE